MAGEVEDAKLLTTAARASAGTKYKYVSRMILTEERPGKACVVLSGAP